MQAEETLMQLRLQTESDADWEDQADAWYFIVFHCWIYCHICAYLWLCFASISVEKEDKPTARWAFYGRQINWLCIKVLSTREDLLREETCI
jgi:hypothetical protein